MTKELKPIEYYFDANASKDTIKEMSDLEALQILPAELQSYQKDFVVSSREIGGLSIPASLVLLSPGLHFSIDTRPIVKKARGLSNL